MERSAYLETKTLRNIMFPNNNTLDTSQLLHDEYIETYLNKLFNSHLHYFGRTFTSADDLNGAYAPIIIKLIITTKDRTGFWLVYEPDKQKVSIPGGHVSKEDVVFVREELGNTENGLLILQEALSREIYEEFYGDRVGHDMYSTNKDLLTVTSECGTNPLDSIMNVVYSRFNTSCSVCPIHDLFYLYKGKNRCCSRSLTFYYVVECDHLSDVMLCPKNFIWLDKEEFRLSCRKKDVQDMFPILGEPLVPVQRDIRFSLKYRPILEIIFNTPELF